MTIEYRPQGTCSRKMIIDAEDGVIRSVRIEGGCSGNLQGISRLVEGMQVEEAIRRITLIGLCTDICVISNALICRAFLPETEIVVDAACCAGVTPATHDAALTTMKMCQIDVL